MRRLVLLALLPMSCADKKASDYQTPDELTTRNGAVYVSKRDGPSCGILRAIDGDAQGWYRQDCPTPTVMAKTLKPSRDDIAQLEAAFAALPSPDPRCTSASKDLHGDVLTLTRRDVLGQKTWIACVGPDGSGFLRVVEPYARADALLTKLTGP